MSVVGVGASTLTTWERLARSYATCWTDLLLIALNVYGLRDPVGSRVRLYVTMAGDHAERLVVVPGGRAGSPFGLVDDKLEVDGERGPNSKLYVEGEPVASVRRAQVDDAVPGYLRCLEGGRWRAATLNPNSRSRCTGCAFCPTTLEAAADPRLKLDDELHDLLTALAAQLPAGGELSDLRDITVSTGCFHTEDAALSHLRMLRRVLRQRDIAARIGFLSSVLKSPGAFEALSSEVSPFLLYLTAECASRRDLLLKQSKASLTPDRMPTLLSDARAAGLDTSFTYIVGLDEFDVMMEFLADLLPSVNVFPSLQIYQPHTPLMDVLRAPDAGELAYYLRARQRIERLTVAQGLVPELWRCYRPLWFTSYAGSPLEGPCI